MTKRKAENNAARNVKRGAVAKQRQIMEEQAAITRLQTELEQRNVNLRKLRQSAYNAQTSAI